MLPAIAMLSLAQMPGDMPRPAPAVRPVETTVSGNDILVVAERVWAPVPGPIKAEQSFDADALGAMGASSLADILGQIAAQTGSSQSRGGGGPVLLVNGRRIGSFDEVRNLPPEAIQRVDVLPEEAALRLGYPASSKPVNVVLKPAYASLSGELEDRVATRGGRNDFNTELNAIDIAGDNRTTFDLQYQIGDLITEAARGVMRPLDARAASAAGLLANPAGGAVLPLAPAILGVPATGRTLADFAAAPVVDDTGRWRTVLPTTRQFTASGVYARAVGRDLTVTANARFDHLEVKDQLGPAVADVLVPAGTGSPFAQAVALRRSLVGEPSVVRRTATDTWHLGGMVAGNGALQWSAAVNYDRIDQDRLRQGGVDAAAYQSALNAGTLADPFAVLPGPAMTALLVPLADRNSASHDQTLSSDLFASTVVAPFRGGDIALSLRGSAGHETLETQQGLSGNRLLRDHAGGQASLDIPLMTRASAVGAVNAGVNLSADHFSDAGSTSGWGVTLNWQPVRKVTLLLAGSRDQAMPTMAQLGAPVEITPDAAFYDYTTGQSIAALRTDGGDAALLADSRNTVKAELGWKPRSGMAVTTTFTHIADHDVLVGFPGLAALAMAALPGRIQRNGAGAIIAVDARPFNADLEQRDEVKLGFSFNRNFSKGDGPRVGGSTFGGGHAFGAQGSMVQFSLIATERLRDDLRLAAGAAPIDLVQGNALGEGLRVPRHRVEAQLSGTHHGFGLRANAVWTSGGTAGADNAGRLDFADRFALNFRLFYYPASNAALLARAPWVKGVRLLLAVDNLFDGYQHVADASGGTPLAYQRGLLDPIGRTVRLSIRKTID